MPLDSRIAMSYRMPQIEGPLDQYRNLAQLQQMLQQNQMGRLQMEEAQRKSAEDMALRQVLSESNGDIPTAINKLVSHGPQGIRLAGVLAEATKDLRGGTSGPFTLTPGARRFGPDGKLIAEASPETKTRTIQMGEDAVTQERQDDGTWKEIGRGPKFAKSVGTTIVNPAPVTPGVVKDQNSPTGWSHADLRTGKISAVGAPPPTQSQEAVGFAGAKLTSREMAEREMAYPEATKQVNIAVENITSLKEQLRSLKMHKGLPGITGAIYGRTPSVSKESMAAQAIYENVVNNIFVNALQAMRAASKTGGAVGNVSDREGDKLQQTLAALSRAQATPDFQKQVGLALDRLEVAQKNIQDAYKSTYEYKNQWKVER